MGEHHERKYIQNLAPLIEKIWKEEEEKERAFSREHIEGIVRKVLDDAKGDQAELLIHGGESALTRFANNIIHQNVSDRGLAISVRVDVGKRQGRFSTNILTEEGLRFALDKAYELAKSSPENPDWLPVLQPQEYRELNNFFQKTADLSPEERAEIVKRHIERCKEKELSSAGILSNDENIIAIANTSGLFAYHRGTQAKFSATTSNGKTSGWAEDVSPDIEKLNFDETSTRSIEKAILNQDPHDIEPGEYTVILEHSAVPEIFIYMAWMAFGARAVIEGTSFLKGKVGKKVFDERITIADDVHHPLSLGIPFDYEGHPTAKVNLIENGVAKGFVHDRLTAKEFGTESTGHALPQPNPYGPIPRNLVISAGDSTLDEMIKTTERGILVTHFHYTNIIDPMRMIVTGMTRDGTFLVEDGKIAYPVKNLRFTQSMIDALNNVVSISRDQKTVSAFFGGSMVVPAMKINNFRFSSTTDF